MRKGRMKMMEGYEGRQELQDHHEETQGQRRRNVLLSRLL